VTEVREELRFFCCIAISIDSLGALHVHLNARERRAGLIVRVNAYLPGRT
jgi:hypothetical protein